MTKYALIDALLSRWAIENGVHWYTKYQDVEVRTFYLNENRKDRVQVAVDAPEGEKITIHIGQNRRGVSRLNRNETIKSAISQLTESLDKALDVARSWVSE